MTNYKTFLPLYGLNLETIKMPWLRILLALFQAFDKKENFYTFLVFDLKDDWEELIIKMIWEDY